MIKKNVLIIFILGLGFSALSLLIFLNKPLKKEVIITIPTTYSFLYDDEKQMQFLLYTNMKSSPFFDTHQIDHIYLVDEKSLKKLNLDITHIELNHKESYLNETYFALSMYTNIPYVSHDFSIDNCHMMIRLNNGYELMIYIGRFHLIAPAHHKDLKIDYQSLYGIKDDQKNIPRLQEIHLYFYNETLHIKDISIGNMLDVSFKVIDQKIVISIPYEDQMLLQCPIVITYEDDAVDYFFEFKYIKAYQMLKESGPFLHVYTPDYT